MTTIAPQAGLRKASGVIEVTGGVDTHKDTHTAAALDSVGRLLGTEQFPATTTGYAALLGWLLSFGPLSAVGVEGTGVYGAGLAAFLQQQNVALVEVDRPDRKTRRFQGKSDPIDAVAAARAVLAGTQTGHPKQRGGPVDALRALRVARRDAVDHRAQTTRRIKALLITAPDPLRDQLRHLDGPKLINRCARLRPDVGDARDLAAADPALATKVALRSLARRNQQLTADIDELEQIITPLVAALAPRLLDRPGIGVDAAGQLLVTAGDNPRRLHSEAAFAALVGVSPIPASSGKTSGIYRLNRGGDRQANATLYRIVLSRLRWDPRTRAYADRRTQEGKSKTAIIRCLKRYIAREIYTDLIASTT